MSCPPCTVQSVAVGVHQSCTTKTTDPVTVPAWKIDCMMDAYRLVLCPHWYEVMAVPLAVHSIATDMLHQAPPERTRLTLLPMAEATEAENINSISGAATAQYQVQAGAINVAGATKQKTETTVHRTVLARSES